MSEWKICRKTSNADFTVRIGHKRIAYTGSLPESREEAAARFWNTTGLSSHTWEIRWAPRGLGGRLPRRDDDEPEVLPDSPQFVTPRLLPQLIHTPRKGSFKEYFSKLTGYSLKKTKLQLDGQPIIAKLVPNNVDI
jgi:hypothetical protein